MVIPAKKKLLVLDVNGFLLDTYFNSEMRPERPADGKVNNHFVYRRPYCNEFIEFCFEKFEVGIWSSAQRHNVDKFVDFIFGDLKSKLLFSWHQTECTDTGLKTPENRWKPVFLKELSNLWNKMNPNLPWEKGDYGPFNTLLIDDSPYKALRNPPHTAVFPYPYKVSSDVDDILGGALRKYLEGLAVALNVQHYVKHHPFGQPPISKESPNWYFYRRILLPMADQNSIWTPSNQEYELQSLSLEDTEVGSQTGNGQISKSGPHITKQKNKHRPMATSTNQYSVTGVEKEENCEVEAAMPNMEKIISLEDREVGLQSVKGQHLESDSPIGKRKKKQGVHLDTSSSQYSVPRMEKEENGVVEAPRANMEKSIGITQPSLSQKHESPKLFMGDKVADLLSDHREPPALGLTQKKKKRKFHQDTSISQKSAPDMGFEDDGFARSMNPQDHESPDLFREDKDADLLSDHRELSVLGLTQKKKKHKFHQDTSLPRESAPNMRLEDDGLARSMNPQDHESPNLFRGDKDAGLLSDHRESPALGLTQKKKKRKFHQDTGLFQESAPDTVFEDDGLARSMNCQDHESPNLFRGDKDADLLSDHREPPALGPSQKKKKRKFHQDTSLSRESAPDMGFKDDGLARGMNPQEHESPNLFSGDKDADLLSDHRDPSALGLTQKKKRKFHQDTSLPRESVPDMRLEDDGLARSMNPQHHESPNLFRGDKDADLLSDHRESPALGLTQKKKRKFRQDTGLSQESAPDIGFEDDGLARSMNCQDHESTNLFRGDKDADLLSDHREPPALGPSQKKKKRKFHQDTSLSQESAPDMGFKDDGLVRSMNPQEHESPNLFSGDKDADLLSDHRDTSALGLTQKKKKRKFHEDSSIFQESTDMGFEDDGLAEAVETCTRRGDTPAASFSQKHEAHNMLCEEREVDAQTDKDCCHNNTSRKSSGRFCDHNNFRDVNNGYKCSNLRKDYPNHRSSNHFQRNRYVGNQASYFRGRQLHENRGHQNGFNGSLQTQVAHGGVYASNNMYCSNTVHANLPLYQWGRYVSDGQVLWPTQKGHMRGGFQYGPRGQSYNRSYIGSAVHQGQSYNPNQGATGLQGPGHNWNHKGRTLVQSPLPVIPSCEQKHTPFNSTQYQGHGKQFQHWKNSSSSNNDRNLRRRYG